MRLIKDSHGEWTTGEAWEHSLSHEVMHLSHPHEAVQARDARVVWAAWSLQSSITQQLPVWLGVHLPACVHVQLWLRWNRDATTSQHLNGQLMRFKQMAKPQDGGLIRQPGSTRIKLRELAKQRHVMQGLFHGRVTQSKPLLHEMNAQHGGQGERRSACLTHRNMRLNQIGQISPWHNQVHLLQKLTLSSTLGDQFKSSVGKGGLFHLPITLESGLWLTYAVTFAENPYIAGSTGVAQMVSPQISARN